MTRIIKPPARRSFQIINPGQAVLFNELGGQAKSTDIDLRRPVDAVSKVGQVLTQPVGDVEAARVMVDASEQDAALAFAFPVLEPAHYRRSAVKVAPATHISKRDIMLAADHSNRLFRSIFSTSI